MKHSRGRSGGSLTSLRLTPLCAACLMALANYAVADDSNGKLKDIEVTAQKETSAQALPAPYAGGQVAKGARIGMLGNVDIMDTPFNVTAYTAQTIEDQQARTVGDVLKNDPSVRPTTSDGHNAENFVVRGFALTSYETAFDGLYGLLPMARMPTTFLERVEFFKGPAAMLSGMSPSGSVGGVINVVPKHAGDTPLTRLTATYATASQWGLQADVSRRFGEENRLGIRVNGAYTNGKTSVDGQNRRDTNSAVALDYRGRGWNLSLDAFDIAQTQSNGSPMMVGFSTLGRVLQAPSGSTNLFKGTYVNQDTSGAVLRGDLALNDDWTLFGAIGHTRYDWNGISVNGTRVVVSNASGNATGQTYGQAGSTESTSGEVGVRGNFRTGSIGHKVVLSASAVNQLGNSAVVTSSASGTTNIYSGTTALALATKAGATYRTSDNTFSSLGASDTLSMLDDKVLLTLGLRAQRVATKSWSASSPTASPTRYNKSAITPAVGVVYKPWSASTSLYANYIEGLSVGETVGTTYSNAGEVLSPYKTKQIETGVKWDAGSFTNTLALFQITKPSGVSISNGDGTYRYATEGEQRHRGLEWNIFGQLTEQVRVLGGVAYTLGKLTKVASTSANAGHTPAGVPKITANLGGEWDLPWVSNTTLEGRVIYTGRQYLDAANTLQLPSWTRLDVGARYATRIAAHNVTFRANVENLTNRAYWTGVFNDGYATIGASRTVKLSASVDF